MRISNLANRHTGVAALLVPLTLLASAPVAVSAPFNRVPVAAASTPDLTILQTTTDMTDLTDGPEADEIVADLARMPAYGTIRTHFENLGLAPTGLVSVGSFALRDGASVIAVAEEWTTSGDDGVVRLVAFKPAGSMWQIYGEIDRIDYGNDSVTLEVKAVMAVGRGVKETIVSSGVVPRAEVDALLSPSNSDLGGITVPELPTDGASVPASWLSCQICQGACSLIKKVGCRYGALALCGLLGFGSGGAAGVLCLAIVAALCRYGINQYVNCYNVCRSLGHCS